MGSFVEIHILQNFAPSNLNRDDTNAPKDCVFGGFRRARISSQCQKRAIRLHESFKQAVVESGGDLGVRTKRLLVRLAEDLVDSGQNPQESEVVADNLLKGAGLGAGVDRKTEYLLYLGKNEIRALTDIGIRHWDVMKKPQAKEEASESAGGKKTATQKKREAMAGLPPEIKKEIAGVFGRSLAADIALFGRMVADDKNMNADAACQVAHAISTNEVSMEMDYFTAVDDLLPEGVAGADMIGTVQFNSSCFYRYAKIDLGLLRRNLDGDEDIVRGAVKGFLEAAIMAIPSGKQNSMAAHNAPSYVRVLARDAGAPWSLTNAFVHPIRPGRKDGEDLIVGSVKALENHLGLLRSMYGDGGIVGDWTSSMVSGEKIVPVSALIAGAIANLPPGGTV